MKIIVPKLKGRGNVKPPVVVIRSERRPAAPKTPPYAQTTGSQFDIGAGPWYYKGKKASSAEYRVLMVLQELGWSPQFQVNRFGGRSIAGGQVLDILISERYPPIYIDVRGYYHRGAAGEANDARKVFQILATEPMTKIIVIWDDQAKDKTALYQTLLHEVGANR